MPLLTTIEELQSLPVKKYTPQTRSLARTVEWLGGVTQETSFKVITKIKNLITEDPKGIITLTVTSPGGASGVAMSFYDLVTKIYKPKLHTIGSGDVDSSGIIIFLSGDKRVITRNTTLLLHMAGRTFDGSKRFTTSEIDAMLQEDLIKDRQYAAIVADRSDGKLTPGKVMDMMRAGTVLTPEEAVQYGLAQSIL
jgi:ATP-dependent protease ClpP protease subunit